jgi:fatty acid desaturase
MSPMTLVEIFGVGKRLLCECPNFKPKASRPGRCSMGPIRDFTALIGVVPFLLVHGSVVGISDSVAVWLFYVQHQFEDTRWAHDGHWNFHEAALHGSSHLGRMELFHSVRVKRWNFIC